MTRVRLAHVIGPLLAGVALGFAATGMTRAAIAAVAIDMILFAWSVETLRHAIASREKRP